VQLLFVRLSVVYLLHFMKYVIWLFCLLSFPLVADAQKKFSVSGTITDEQTGEALIGATVFVSGLDRGTATNLYGFYSLTLDEGEYDMKVSYIGYDQRSIPVKLSAPIRLDIELAPMGFLVQEAVIETENTADKNINSTDMSAVSMQMSQIKKIPAFMGEVDVIKAIQLLPGVQTVGEGTSGFYVRGGAVDQNLILLDESPVYNASHLLGFFSVFNSDAIKDVQLYKGGIPARYGGRLSSVLDIHMKDGNSKQWHAQGGVGTIASRLTVEGPIVKDKGSIMISGRRTYADLFLKLSKNEALRNTKLYFYDLNLKANYKITENDRLYLSGYFGRDVSSINDLFGFSWGNATGTLRWNHLYNNKLFSNLTFIYSNFDYRIEQNIEQFGFIWESKIKDVSAKLDYSYFLNPNNTLQFGVQSTYRSLDPGFARASGDASLLIDQRIPLNFSFEHGIYISNEQAFNDRFSANYGVRYSLFQNVGAGTIYNFEDAYNLTDSNVYAKGDVFNTYGGFEPRIGLKYSIDNKSSVKASYNRTRQYLQIASNSTASSPLDVWFSASPNVKPQIADQVALGYFRNIADDVLEASVEVYYKDMQNTIDFANHANLLLNKYIEGELRFGQARSYGLEFLLRKQAGDLTGMVSYTLSRSERKITAIEKDWYPSFYDKTHDVALVLAYTLSQRWSVATNFVYSTGNAVTMPTGRFEYMGMVVPVYSDRNGSRMPAYHRLDLSATLQPKKNADRKWQGEWVFSVYNAYFRKNAYTINFRQDANDPNVTYAEKTYLLPIVPAVTYNFKF
jgi:hypothetical protein